MTEFTAYNNGGSGVNAYAYKGTNLGNNHYTVELAVPPDTATAVAKGTARVVTIGQIKEPKLQTKWATDPRPEVVPKTLINTVAQHTYMDVALSGAVQPRRQVVSNERCNVCHGALGSTSGSNTLAEAFHSGARNTVEACQVCHDANRASSTVMTSGLTLNESYQFKRMIHGIHGNSKRTYPFTHGNPVYGSFTKDGILLTTGTAATAFKLKNGTNVAVGATLAPGGGEGFANWLVGNPPAPPENYAAEVAYPDLGLNCNACHVNNSYQTDRGPWALSSRSRPASPTRCSGW